MAMTLSTKEVMPVVVFVKASLLLSHASLLDPSARRHIVIILWCMKLKVFCRKYPLATLVCSLVLVMVCASFLPEDGLWLQIAKSFMLSLVALACAWPFLPGLRGKGGRKASGSSFGEGSQGASISRQVEGSVEVPIMGDPAGTNGVVFTTRMMRLTDAAHMVHPGCAGNATVAAGASDSENLRDEEDSACAESAKGPVGSIGSVGATHAGDAMGFRNAGGARGAAGLECAKRADSLGILSYAAFLLAAALVGGVASAISTASGFHLNAPPHDLGFWAWRGVQVALLCLTTAVFEEALFRGVVFSCLVERFRICGLPIPACFEKYVSQNSARKGSVGKGDAREGDARKGDVREGETRKGNAGKGDVREGNAREILTGNGCGSGCEKEEDFSWKQECSGYGLESPESPRLPEAPEAMGLPEIPGLPKPSEMIGLSKSLRLSETSEMTGLPGLLGLLKLSKPPSLPKTPKTPKSLGLSGAPGLSPLPKTLGSPGELGLAEVAAAALSAILFGLLHVSVSDMGMIAHSLESLASMGFSGDSATFSQLQLSLALSAQMIFKITQASLFGFCMAALFVKTHSLLAPVVVHAVFDVFYLGPQVLLAGVLPSTYMTGNCVDLAILVLTIALLLPPSFKSARWLAYEVVPYSSFNRQKRWFGKGSA